jgi:hypothetical protein
MQINLKILLYPFIKASTPPGPITGECAFCTEKTRGVFADSILRKTFLQFPELARGNILCPQCQAIYEDQSLRKKHWFAWHSLDHQDTLFQYIDRSEIKDLLLTNLKKGYWAMYVTESHKLGGWIKGFRTVNASTENFQIITDEFILSLNRMRLKELCEKTEMLLNFGLTKSAIRSGELSPMQVQKLLDNLEMYATWHSLKAYAKSPVLNFVTYICDKAEEKKEAEANE